MVGENKRNNYEGTFRAYGFIICILFNNMKMNASWINKIRALLPTVIYGHKCKMNPNRIKKVLAKLKFF